MKTYKREINPLQYQASEDRILSNVMDNIRQKQQPKKRLSFRIWALLFPLVTALVIVFVLLTTMDNPFNPNTPNSPLLSDFQNRKLAEISYISGSLIAANTPSPTVGLTRLSTNQTTLEDNLPTINIYFDMLRAFLEDEAFTNDLMITELSDSDYDTLMSFTSQGITYDFYLTLSDSKDITGELFVGTHQFTVTGSIQETTLETEITLEARSTINNDYVYIEYETETEDEIETEYIISTSFSGITNSKSIKIERENNESSVEIRENGNVYQLEKELENGQIEYELQYVIDGIEGAAVIYLNTDTNGNEYYVYQITEGDHESEVEYERPDYDDDHDDQSYQPLTPNQVIQSL